MELYNVDCLEVSDKDLWNYLITLEYEEEKEKYYDYKNCVKRDIFDNIKE